MFFILKADLYGKAFFVIFHRTHACNWIVIVVKIAKPSFYVQITAYFFQLQEIFKYIFCQKFISNVYFQVKMLVGFRYSLKLLGKKINI